MFARSVSKRLCMAFAAILLLCTFQVRLAYADEYEGGGGGSHNIGGSYPAFGTVWYGPESNGDYMDYGVVAYTHWDAAMYCLGYNDGSEDFSNLLTADQKRRLLSGSNAFMTFANKFKTGKPDLSGNIIMNNDFPFISSWNSARELYGETYCYWTKYVTSEYHAAALYVENVLEDEGGSSGGGGGIVSAGDPFQQGSNIYIPVMPYASNWNNDSYHIDYVALSTSAYNSLNTYAEENNMEIFAFVAYGGGWSSPPWEQNIYARWFVMAADESNLEWNDYYISAKSQFVTNIQTGYTSSVNSPSIFIKTVKVGNENKKYVYCDYTYQNRTYGAGILSDRISGSTDGVPNRVDYDPVYYLSKVVDSDEGGSGEDDEPPVEWPNPPAGGTTNTQPPEVPTPTDPDEPTAPDTPTPPTPPSDTTINPWIPIPNDDVQITGDDFQDLLDALNEHCIHLQDSIEDNVSQLWDNQSSLLSGEFGNVRTAIADNFNTLLDYLADAFAWLGNDVIFSAFNDLKTYLYQLFDWLAQQMNFNVNVEGGQYDDSSVIYWLKRIWAKLGSGDINTRPTDPVVNPTGWWDWLTKLLNDLAADLIMLGQEGLADIVAQLNNLRTRFPFSLPWDLGALLGLLVGVPVCPEVDLPILTITSNYELEQVGTMHITLEDYDEVWAGVRWIETLAFTVYLISNTNGLVDMMKRTVRAR